VIFALACACLALAGPASAGLSVGVTDDRPLGQPDGGTAFFTVMNDVGLREVRISIWWDAANPTLINNQAEIQNVLPVAALRGVKVVLSVTPLKAKSITVPGADDQFVAFVTLVAQTFPAVKDVIVGNEPNQPRFWQPQFNAKGKQVSGGAYEALLARSYDALKAVDPTINVIGLGISSRGNDNPNASGNISTSPVRFLKSFGAAYRASGRTKPVMDEMAFHPYPNKNTDGLNVGHAWPNAGVTNFDRVKQAFWDAFNGSAQKTFEQGLRAKLDEVGWQVQVSGDSAAAYFGVENITPTSEANQAAIYAAFLRYAACDASFDSVLFFGLQDEPDLDRWQAGLMRADGTTRPSYDSVKATIAATNGECDGAMRRWRHSTTVDGAEATFRREQRFPRRVTSWSFLASADEDALFDAGIYRIVNGHRAGKALGESGRFTAHLTRYVRFPAKRLRPGKYVYSIRFRADANQGRTTTLTSRRFLVLKSR
jgi:hypothetical protein